MCSRMKRFFCVFLMGENTNANIIIKAHILQIRIQLVFLTHKIKYKYHFLFVNNIHEYIQIFQQKNPAYGGHHFSQPRRIVGPIQFRRSCMIYIFCMLHFFLIFFKGCVKKRRRKMRGCKIFFVGGDGGQPMRGP